MTNYRLLLVSLIVGLSSFGCEVNIENPGVAGGDAGANADENVDPNNNVEPNNTPNNNADAGPNGDPNNMADANNTPNNTPDGGDNNVPSNNDVEGDDVYPCSDTPEIPKMDCQGSAAWDAYEDPALIARGEYIATHLAACQDCHTPLTEDFLPEAGCEPWEAIRACSKRLSGFNLPFYDMSPIDGVGGVGVPNITPHPDGIGQWTPEEVRTAFTKGVRPEWFTERPRIMFPYMPYYQFAHMTKDDQDAVIAFLHSITAVPNGDPPAGPYDREPQATGSVWEVLDTLEPIDKDGDGEVDGLGPAPDDFMPAITLDPGDPDYDTAVQGRYLARLACVACHTPGLEPPAGMSDEDLLNNWYFQDPTKAMAGSTPAAVQNSSWFAGSALYGPAFPDVIGVQNITNHPNGTGDWTLDEVLRSVNGTDRNNEPMCPPMYVDTWFAEMTDEDKTAIATYLKNSEGNDNDTNGMDFDCVLP